MEGVNEIVSLNDTEPMIMLPPTAENNLLASMLTASNVENITETNPFVQQSFEFQTLCSRCQKSDPVHQAFYSTNRESIRSYLLSDPEGVLSLAAIESHGDSVHESIKGSIARLLIKRELDIVLRRERVSVQNPLRHFE